MKRIKQWLAARRLERTMKPEPRRRPSRAHVATWDTRRGNGERERMERFANDPIIREVATKKDRIHYKDAVPLRSALYLRDGPLCHYCRATLQITDWKAPLYATIEHKIPLFVGGTYDMENLVLACAPCNGARGNGAYLAKRVRHILARIEA